MQIVRVKTRNVKGISFVEVTPHSGMTVIGGSNGAGKSSFLDSIAYALGGASLCPKQPIREGQTEGLVEVELNGDQNLMIQPCVITRRFWFDKNGEIATNLMIKTKQGFTAPSPQTIVDAVVGKLGFDPERFLRMDAKQQAAVLRSIVGLDFTKIDDERKKLYTERTQVNKDGVAKKAVFESMNGFPEAPAEEVSVASLMDELKKREDHNAKNVATRKEHDILLRKLDGMNSDLSDAQGDVADMERKLAEAKTRLAVCEKWISDYRNVVTGSEAALKLLVDQNAAEVREKIGGSQEVNRQVRSNAERAKAEKELQRLRDNSAELTKKLKAIDDDKEKQLSSAKWPVPGLGFTDDGMTFQGLPFEQVSAKEKRQVAFGINCAGSPALRFAFIQDGSLLDDEALKEFAEIAADHKMQLFVERVGEGDEMNIVIENGSIKRADEGFLPKESSSEDHLE